jgi:hypothetical protein
VNYVVKTPGQRKEKRVRHINMLKEYFDRCDQTSEKSVSTLANVETLENCTENDISVEYFNLRHSGKIEFDREPCEK